MRSAHIVILFLAFLLASCNAGQESRPLINGMVDDFDDGNTTNVFQNSWQSFGTGGSNVQALVLQGGYGESRFYLSVQGTHVSGDAGVNTKLTLGSRENVVSDVSAYKGLAFVIKGTPGTYIVQLRDARVEDGAHYNAYIQVEQSWVEQKIPFSRFKQESYGVQLPWDGKNITGIAFYVNPTGLFQFDIDHVNFYR